MTIPQTWFITGTNGGIGRALTGAALSAGHRVVATTRSPGSLSEHDRLTICELDVRDRQACRDTIKVAAQRHGGIDVLVNNAGYGLVGAIEEVSEDEARGIIDTDLLGALWLTQAVLPFMRAQRSGHIVQISTVGGVGAMPFFGLYNAAKWGLEGFSEALAGEVKGFGIRTTIAELGAVDTEWATNNMRFSEPVADYDGAREQSLGTASVPWNTTVGATGGGTSPDEIADALLRHIDDPSGGDRLRLLVGSDAPEQVATVLRQRHAEYSLDPRFDSAFGG